MYIKSLILYLVCIRSFFPPKVIEDIGLNGKTKVLSSSISVCYYYDYMLLKISWDIPKF